MEKNITVQTIKRLPYYLNYLKSLPKDSFVNISATTVATALGLNDVQVRKDLASVSDGGKPKIGYNKEVLIQDIEEFLGYNDADSAIIVGMGNLGHALMSYSGFAEYGLDIVAGFDNNKDIIGTSIGRKKVRSVEEMQDFCKKKKIHIGIIAVPAKYAQGVCDALVQSGVMAIWNFAPAHLVVSEDVLVQNENMASSLAVLSKHLTAKLNNE